MPGSITSSRMTSGTWRLARATTSFPVVSNVGSKPAFCR